MNDLISDIKLFRSYMQSMNLIDKDNYLYSKMNYNNYKDLSISLMYAFGWPSFKCMFYISDERYYGLDDRFLSKNDLPSYARPLYIPSKKYSFQGTYIATNLPIKSEFADSDVQWIMDRKILLPISSSNINNFSLADCITLKAYDFGIGLEFSNPLSNIHKYLIGKIYLNIFKDIFTEKPSQTCHLNPTVTVTYDKTYDMCKVIFKDRYHNYSLSKFTINRWDIFTGTIPDQETLDYYHDYHNSVGNYRGYYPELIPELRSETITDNDEEFNEGFKKALKRYYNARDEEKEETSYNDIIDDKSTILILLAFIFIPLLLFLSFCYPSISIITALVGYLLYQVHKKK